MEEHVTRSTSFQRERLHLPHTLSNTPPHTYVRTRTTRTYQHTHTHTHKVKAVDIIRALQQRRPGGLAPPRAAHGARDRPGSPGGGGGGEDRRMDGGGGDGGDNREHNPTDLDARGSAQRLAPQERQHERQQRLHGRFGLLARRRGGLTVGGSYHSVTFIMAARGSVSLSLSLQMRSRSSLLRCACRDCCCCCLTGGRARARVPRIAQEYR